MRGYQNFASDHVFYSVTDAVAQAKGLARALGHPPDHPMEANFWLASMSAQWAPGGEDED